MSTECPFSPTAEIFQGTLTRVRFKNENGFLIGEFQAEKSNYAAIGTLIRPEEGMEYKLFGKWINDPQWGKQFKFTKYEVMVPKDTDGILRYIVRVARWVGPKIGAALIAEYGEKTLDALRDDPCCVARDIKGITEERALEIQTLIKQNQEIESAMVELESLVGGQGLRKSLPMDLIVKFGANAADVLRENPYKLTEIHGVGFPSADRVAINRFKVDPASVARATAAMLHVLRENEFEGHTWMSVNKLFEAVKNLTGRDVKEGLEGLREKKLVIVDGEFVALARTAHNERFVAEKIMGMLNGNSTDGPTAISR